jgi:hypothetical protein
MKNELIQRLAHRADTLCCSYIGETFPDAEARRGRCHENVQRWLKENPGSRRVWGWLIDRDYLETAGYITFAAHSIIQSTDGEFVDITLREDQSRYGFLSSDLNETEFDLFRHGNNELRHVVNRALYESFLLALSQPPLK